MQRYVSIVWISMPLLLDMHGNALSAPDIDEFWFVKVTTTMVGLYYDFVYHRRLLSCA